MSAPVNPLIAERHDTTRGWTGIGIVEDVHDLSAAFESGSWVDGSLAGLSASLDTLGLVVDPLGTVVSWGVSWLFEHVKPLSDALDRLAGDPDQITAYAQTWSNVSAAVTAQAGDLGAAVGATVSSWTGAAADAYRAQAHDLQTNVQAAAKAAEVIGKIVEGAGVVVALVRGLVRDLIAEFVSVLAVRLPEWLAEEGCTLGIATPLVVTQVGSLVAKWAAKISEVVRALTRSLRKLSQILGRLHELLDGVFAALRSGRRAAAGADTLGVVDSFGALPSHGALPDGLPSHGGLPHSEPAGWHTGAGSPADGTFWPPDSDLGSAPHVGSPDPGVPTLAGQVETPPVPHTPHTAPTPTGTVPPDPYYINRIDEALGSGGPPRRTPDTPSPSPHEPTGPRTFSSNAEGARYGQTTWEQAQNQLTDDQRHFLNGYTRERDPRPGEAPNYKDINGYLRGRSPGDPQVEAAVRHMDEAMRIQPVPEDVVVLRETGYEAFNAPMRRLDGTVQCDPAYLSTALGNEPNFKPQAPVVLHLQVPAGTPAMYMEGLSVYDSEHELLLGRNLPYLVERSEEVGGRWHVYARVITESK
ncbi:hypothetical protein HC031_20975 [Planosporangium thailandense]|uniref:ADP ribosyltransferase domain-containing protein n=1 Tax=Planosporangium thailandense TaxID=765197 RepID=A0ABX0Y1E2_9ACTN|nr:hypothetical protein [Planosporangium thailandense]